MRSEQHLRALPAQELCPPQALRVPDLRAQGAQVRATPVLRDIPHGVPELRGRPRLHTAHRRDGAHRHRAVQAAVLRAVLRGDPRVHGLGTGLCELPGRRELARVPAHLERLSGQQVVLVVQETSAHMRGLELPGARTRQAAPCSRPRGVPDGHVLPLPQAHAAGGLAAASQELPAVQCHVQGLGDESQVVPQAMMSGDWEIKVRSSQKR